MYALRHEKSCGGVVFNGNKVLLIKNKKAQHWSFPKGHMEKGETKIMTAQREIFEETNVKVFIQSKVSCTISYRPYEGAIKRVTYFLAFYQSGDLIPQEEEISDIGWFNIEEALDLITYKDEVKVLNKIYEKRTHYLEKKFKNCSKN